MNPLTARERHLRKWMERAVIDFDMIAPGDGVLAAISGGKDSLTMMQLLRGPFVNMTNEARFEFAHIDGGFPGGDADAIRRFAGERGINLHIVKRDIYENIFGQKKSPCFLCARMRRKALAELADELGCSKIAIAQHRDDAIETFMMNFMYNREISTMMPVQSLFDGKVRIIRPLYYISALLIKRFVREQGIQLLEAPCPAEKENKREFARNLLEAMRKDQPKVYESIFSAMFRVKTDYLPRPPDGKNPPKLPRDV